MKKSHRDCKSPPWLVWVIRIYKRGNILYSYFINSISAVKRGPSRSRYKRILSVFPLKQHISWLVTDRELGRSTLMKFIFMLFCLLVILTLCKHWQKTWAWWPTKKPKIPKMWRLFKCDLNKTIAPEAGKEKDDKNDLLEEAFECWTIWFQTTPGCSIS